MPNIDYFPQSGAPLYLILEGVDDIQALGVDLRWSPDDLTGPCFWIGPDTTESASCGSVNCLPPIGGLGSDSTFQWTIHFLPGSNRRCVVYNVRGENCDSRPASFCLASVQVMNAGGEITSLDVTGGATLWGGVEDGCPLALDGVSPSRIEAGSTATITVTGAGFDSETEVSLALRDTLVGAQSITQFSESRLSATFEVPPGLTGVADVVVTSAAGVSDTLTDLLVLEDQERPYQQNTVIAWFRPGVIALPSGATRGALSQAAFQPPSEGTLLQGLGVDSLRLITPRLSQAAESPLDVYVLQLADTNVIATCAALSADTANVLSAEINPVGHFCGAVLPNDTEAKNHRQWWIRNEGPMITPNCGPGQSCFPGAVAGMDCNATEAWYVRSGGPTRVYMIDSGCDAGHPDLGARVTTVIAPGGNGMDVINHGTAVAGIIGATGNNGQYIAGINWDAQITSYKIGTDATNGFGVPDYTFLLSDLYGALDDILGWWDADSSIICLALSFDGPTGGYEPLRALHKLLRIAWTRSILVVGSSCNNNGSTAYAPGRFKPFVMAVGAFDFTGARWSDINTDGIPWAAYRLTLPPPTQGSGYGDFMDIVAPGGRFIQTLAPQVMGGLQEMNPSTGHFGFGGTSAATAITAGAASLLQAQLRGMGLTPSNEDLAQILDRTTRGAQANEPWNQYEGFGRIDVGAAMRYVVSPYQFYQGQAGYPHVHDDSLAIVPGHAYVTSWPGLPIGDYDGVEQHALSDTGYFALPYSSAPVVWPRLASSSGRTFFNFVDQNEPTAIPFARVLNVDQQRVVLRTYVYRLHKTGAPPMEQWYWWPTDPTQAWSAYTAYGLPQNVGVLTNEAPRGLVLSCGPSPARASLRLSLELPSTGAGRLEVFDVRGARVATLVDGLLASGRHEYRWDLRTSSGAPVNAGIYFARARTALGTRTQSFVVLR